MRITLLLLFFASNFVHSQQKKISFEAVEGFHIGSVHTQADWKLWGIENDTYTVVNDEKSSDGSRSLKIASSETFKDDFGIETIIPFYEKAQISFDVLINNLNSSDYSFVVYNANYDIIAGLNFNSPGLIEAYNEPGFHFSPTNINFTNDTWYNFKIDLDFANKIAAYKINDAPFYESSIGSGYNSYNLIDVRTDDFGGDFYIDNILVSDRVFMSAENINQKNRIKIYPNPIEDFINILSDEKITQIDVISQDGKLMLSEKPNNHTLSFDFNQLTKGVYYIKVIFKNKTETHKIIKN